MTSENSWFHWNPSREIFTIPFLDHPITWYGLLFALGFLAGILVFRHLASRHIALCQPSLKKEEIAKRVSYFVDSLLWYVVIGVVVGGRLGHVLFYGWPYFKTHPLDIIKVWEGGLASHGGAIGVLFALIIYFTVMRKKIPEISFLFLLDLLALPAAILGVFIRLGNFINQEILGKVTFVSWAVIFGDPYGGAPALPRHPVQLYEALYYFILFVTLYTLWLKRERLLKEGVIAGLFLCAAFVFRFFVEFYKLPQSLLVNSHSGLLMGQYLSVPFILIGVLLILWSKQKTFR